MYLLVSPDLNECLSVPCDPNADCTNTIGAFECACQSGYTGTGLVCEGKFCVTLLSYHFFSSSFQNKSNYCDRDQLHDPG